MPLAKAADRIAAVTAAVGQEPQAGHLVEDEPGFLGV